MRPTFLKPSTVEPNFAFGLGNGDGPVGSTSPDSADYNQSDHSDFVLQKVEPSGQNYRMSSGAALVVACSITGHLTYRQRLSAHCQSKWTLYIIVTLGLVSISGCIAAGVALAAVQPYLVEDLESSTEPAVVLFPHQDSPNSGGSESQARNDDQTGAAKSKTTTDIPPDVAAHIFSTIRDAGLTLRERSLELRNTTSTTRLTTPSGGSDISSDINTSLPSSPDIAAQSVREVFSTVDLPTSQPSTVYPLVPRYFGYYSPVPPASSSVTLPILPVAHVVETIPKHEKRLLFQQTSRYTVLPVLPRKLTSPVLHYEDNREPDRFPDPHRPNGLDPLTQDLNITFVEPFSELPRKPLVLRSFVKRAVQIAVSSRDRPAAPLNLGTFTMMRPSGKTVEIFSTKLDIAAEGHPVEPKALLPDVALSAMCEAGFDWDPTVRDCRDVDECLQMGIRACGVHSECTNSPGTFTCRCSPGFRLDPKSLVCTDIDECKESNGECSPLAQCINLPGGFVCRCSEGFYGNGIVCEIDGNSPASLPCQTSLSPRSHQIVSSPYFPALFKVHSRYKFCVQKIHEVCKMGFTIQHFTPSTAGHQDFDHLTIQSKVISGTDQTGQTLWLLDSGEAPVEVEFATDSDPRGNRFTMEIVQEQCGQTISVPECTDLLNVEGNSITSAGPHYIDNLQCTTALYPPHDACGMDLKFHEFALEGPRETCLYDYLEINEDKLCGNLRNEQREIIFPRNTPKIPIIFSTDGSFVAMGFNITFSYITECYQHS